MFISDTSFSTLGVFYRAPVIATLELIQGRNDEVVLQVLVIMVRVWRELLWLRLLISLVVTRDRSFGVS